jgi:hypothetical protein
VQSRFHFDKARAERSSILSSADREVAKRNPHVGNSPKRLETALGQGPSDWNASPRLLGTMPKTSDANRRTSRGHFSCETTSFSST